MSMMDVIKDVSSNFHYGQHPSIIMWSNGEVVQEEDSTEVFGSVAKAMESITTSATPESFSSFKFDAIVSEGHEADTVVTKFPVSSGFLVSDSTITQNRILHLEAVASNMQNAAMWSASIQGLSVFSGAIFNNPMLPVLGGVVGTVASAFETSDRMQSTFNLFNGFRVNGTKLYISTILGPYLNCIVTGIRAKTDSNTAAILAVQITLEELQVIGEDQLAAAARTSMQNSYDYSEFAKIAQSMGVGVLGGVPLPGLGVVGDLPSKQLSNLKGMLGKLSSPISSVKGRLL